MNRLLESLLVLFCIIAVNFMLIRFMPGDPLRHLVGEEEFIYLRSRAPEVLEELRAEYGLDKPLASQFFTYLGKTLRLDFGVSYKNKQSVLQIVGYRMALARVMLMRPDVLILDEPTSMLDVISQAQVIHMLRDIQKKHAMGYLFISHDRALCKFFCDEILAIEDGVVAAIPPE